MTLEDALSVLLQAEGPAVLRDSFRCKCVLSDSIQGDRYQRKLLDVFLSVNAEFDLYDSFMTKGLAQTRADLKVLYPKYKTVCGWEEFRDAVNALAAYCCPEELQAARGAKKESATKKPGKKKPKGEGPIVIGAKKDDPQTKPKAPKKAAVVDLHDVTTLRIKLDASDFHIYHKKGPDAFVLMDGKKVIPLTSAIATQTGTKLDLDLTSFPTKLRLYCSRDRFHLIQIKGENSNVEIHDRVRADRYDLYSENGSIVGNLYGHSAKVGTYLGFMDFETYLDELSISSKFGEIVVDASGCGLSHQKIEADLDMGSFELKVGRKLSPRPTKLLGRTRAVQGRFSTPGGPTFDLDLKTRSGGIRIH